MEKKLVLIDAYSFLFRAFFAIKDLRKKDGTPINGVYGFTRMIINLLVDLNASHIAVVFDSGQKTFRSTIYPEYKINRPPVPEDLIPQFAMVREVVSALHLPILEKIGYEADDVIATLARQAKEQDFQVLIVSPDKDLLQLVDDNVFVFDPMKNKEIHSEDVLEKWQVEPKKILDFLALTGDTADNVPGVPNIGPKTAASLLANYESIEDLINHIDLIQPNRIRETLKNNLDKLLLSKKLVELATNIDLIKDLDDLKIRKINPVELRDFLYKMELYSIAHQVEIAFNITHEQSSYETHRFKYKKITDQKILETCIESLSKNNQIYIDLVTNLDESNNNPVYLAIIDSNKKYINLILLNSNHNDNLLYIPNSNYLSIDVVLQKLKPIFENPKIKKVSCDTKKLISILKTLDIKLDNYDDIIAASYVLNAGKFEQKLSKLIEVYLYDNFELHIENIDIFNKLLQIYEKNKELSKITNDISQFANFRIEMIFYLYKYIFELLDASEQKNIYYDIEKPLIEVLADMEYRGITIDVGVLNILSRFFQENISTIGKKIFDIAGQEFNIASPKQLGEVLFNKLQLPGKKTTSKTGNLSTNIDILESLSEKGFTIADQILEWRHLSKLKSTYSDILPKLIDKNNRVHTTYSNTAVITGRLSSSNPNLQNIPIKTEEGAKIRNAFIAKPGYKLIGADYSQIELRVLAEYAQVTKLIESFHKNEDIHLKTARTIFDTDDITSDMRRMAKIINFSIIYGSTSFGLAKRLGISNKAAQNYIDNYFNTYPEIKDYINSTLAFARDNGFVKTLFGRICHIVTDTKLEKTFAERLIINAPIQGSAADIIKIVMVELYNKLQKFDAKILLQVHDELIIEVIENQADEVLNLVKKIMENTVKLQIKLIANVKLGNNWGEIH